MQDSDDDHYPDFTLDDQTLAFLVEEESKFIQNTQPTTLPADASPPPKRQKTTTSWKSVRPTHRNESTDDLEDLPDISVQVDGTYALQDRQRQAHEQTSQPQIVQTASPYSQLRRGSDLASPLTKGAPPLRARSVTTPSRGTLPPFRPAPPTRAVHTSTPISSQNIARSQSGPSPRLNNSVAFGVSDALFADLRRQVEEVRALYLIFRSNNPCIQHFLYSSVKATSECSLPYKMRKVIFRTLLTRSLLKREKSRS